MRALGGGILSLLPLVMLIGLLAGVALSIHRYVTTTPYFRLSKLELSGNHRISEADIKKAAGIDDTTHLLLLDPDNIAQSLKKHPWIADSRVERFLPDRLVIRIVERKPAALILLEDLYLVDELGFVFIRSSGQGDERLPIITGLSHESIAVEQNDSNQQIREALAVIREWKHQRLPEIARLSEVHLDSILGMVLFTEETGTRIQLGWSEHAERLAKLREVLLSLKAEGKRAKYVLLDNETTPDRVTVGLIGEISSACDLPGPGLAHVSQ